MGLADELAAGVVVLGQVLAKVRAAEESVRTTPTDWQAQGNLALRLQHFYGCIEDMAYRVSVQVNGEVPAGPGGHKALLERTAIDVPGKRRALWRTAALEDLDDLRKFRHFVRTNYAVDLDPAKLLAVAAAALRVGPRAEADVRSFLETLGAA